MSNTKLPSQELINLHKDYVNKKRYAIRNLNGKYLVITKGIGTKYHFIPVVTLTFDEETTHNLLKILRIKNKKVTFERVK